MSDIVKDDKMHLRKEVSYGHILTTVIMVVSAIWFFGELNTRIAVLEAERVSTQAQLDRIERQIDRVLDELDEKADKE